MSDEIPKRNIDKKLFYFSLPADYFHYGNYKDKIVSMTLFLQLDCWNIMFMTWLLQITQETFFELCTAAKFEIYSDWNVLAAQEY